MENIILFALLSNFIFAATLPACQNGFHSNASFCSLESNYDKNMSPPNPPIPLQITVLFKRIADIDEEKQTISLVAYVMMSWNDSRIRTPNISQGNFNHLMDSIWMPRVWMENSNGAKSIRTLGIKKSKILTLIPKYGITYYEQLFITFECKMNFDTFPFDTQRCALEFVGENPVDQMKLHKVRLIIINGNIPTASTSINSTGLSFEVHMQTPDPYVVPYPDGDFSFVILEIGLRRKSSEFSKLTAAYFFPSGSFAILSLFSYFIKPDVVPGRMGMLVTIFLIVTGIYKTVEAPSKRGYGIIELYYAIVQVPIIIALVEYGIILAILKYKDGHEEVKIFGKTKIINDILSKVDLISFSINAAFLIISGTFLIGHFLSSSST